MGKELHKGVSTSFYCPGELRERMMEHAQDLGVSASRIIIAALEKYLRPKCPMCHGSGLSEEFTPEELPKKEKSIQQTLEDVDNFINKERDHV